MIFLLDTTVNPTTIGFYNGDKFTTKTIESNPENNRKLIGIIRSFLQATSHNLQAISAVGVVNGPGTFTGVRTGVTIANAISYVLNVPIYSVDTLTSQISVGTDNHLSKKKAQNFVPLQDINNVISILSASNSEVFFARFSKGKMVGKIEIVDVVNNLPNRIKKEDLIVGDLQEKHCEIWGSNEFIPVTSKERIECLLQMIINKKLKPVKQVLPLYIKKPNITQAKKKK